jgi:sporulation protein YlmC with PRC-barrel domain
MRATLAAVTALMIAASPAAAQTNAPATPGFAGQQNKSQVLGTDFIGTPVVTKNGQKIGEIANLVFDQEGKIELAVIGVGGFLGLGEKMVAVPFGTVKSQIAGDKHVFVVDVTTDQFKAAPTFKTLDVQTYKERMNEWHAKALQGWGDIKKRASQMYEEAKERVEEPGTQKQ